MDYGIPKMDFGRREIKDGGDAEGYQTKGLKVRERSPLKIVIYTNEERRGSETGVEGREGPIVRAMHKLA